MPNYLVIVESPAKVDTIKKFLGSNYNVTASMGHVRDLPKSSLGIDVENDFEPKYITIRGKGQLVSNLKKAAKNADKIYLATDPDREGEAISWHLAAVLDAESKKISRITFNEITKTAVKDSLKNARSIDQDLVDEQQARRCLDRMVGYEISPILWKKVKRGLSAGRVQSVALRIIADRDAEIAAFVPEEYWSLDADLAIEGRKKPVRAHFYGKNGKKIPLDCEETVSKIIENIENSDFTAVDVKTGERGKKAPLPFTTSTLQQEASKVLNFTTQKTMRVAQQLYEGVKIKGQGSVGLISYLRTDSTRVSEAADAAAKDFVAKQYGKGYVSYSAGNADKAKGNIQDAHEAIRPTDVERIPAQIASSLTRDQLRLYQLIWKRFVASRMKPAVYNTANVNFNAGDYVFTAAASKIAFEGFLAVYKDDDEKNEDNPALFHVTEGMKLKLSELTKEQHFTQAPPHFTEAALVKAMEELGIGRPSTYAPTITTILNRRYVTKEKKNLYITELGEVVNNLMMESFPKIVDVNFTADMESVLDGVGEGKTPWKKVMADFWPGLTAAVKKAEKELEHVKLKDEVTNVICERCGRNMVIKQGPHGKFLACPGFPECRNTKPFLEKTGAKCPQCGGDIVVRRSKKGRRYYGCENFPDCDYMSWSRPSSKR